MNHKSAGSKHQGGSVQLDFVLFGIYFVFLLIILALLIVSCFHRTMIRGDCSIISQLKKESKYSACTVYNHHKYFISEGSVGDSQMFFLGFL